MSEPDVSDLLSVQRAIEILDAAPVAPRVGQMKLGEARGLRLAADIRTDRDYPPFDKSMMDGFALHAADAGNELRVVGEVRAGGEGHPSLGCGEAVAIMTGAPLPAGADAVVPVEFAQRDGEKVYVTKPADFSRFVARHGSDCPAGSVVLQRGMQLDAAQLAVAATVGASVVSVFTPPSVAILTTGDELIPIGQSPVNSQIRNSNSLMLDALLTRYGCRVSDMGIVRDEEEATAAAIAEGLKHDALFISGGMSVGAYDLPPRILARMGATFQITKLKIKPGKPFLFAQIGRCSIFGLPGNPLAGFVCTVRLASRVIARMQGALPAERWLHGTLAEALPANGPREFYQPVKFDGEVVQPLPWKGSADVFTLARADALLVRAENEPAQPVGARCRLMALPT